MYKLIYQYLTHYSSLFYFIAGADSTGAAIFTLALAAALVKGGMRWFFILHTGDLRNFES